MRHHFVNVSIVYLTHIVKIRHIEIHLTIAKIKPSGYFLSSFYGGKNDLILDVFSFLYKIYFYTKNLCPLVST